MDNKSSRMSDAEAMSEFARLLWERYMKPRAQDELLNHSLDGYKAQVVSNNSDGTLTVLRPFDSVSMTLRCPPALAESAETGDQVLIIQLGDASNSFILCGTDMSGFGEGGDGAEFRPITLDFSDISDGYFTETVEDEKGTQITTVYDVTFDANGRIDSVTSRTDGWETEVDWGTYERIPATEIGYDNTGTTLTSDTVQGALNELANGGGGGGSGASETIIATVEATATASKNYVAKDYLILSGVLYRVTTPISLGSAITIGTNVTPAVLGNDLSGHIQNNNNPHNVTAAQAGALPDSATLDDIPDGSTYAKPTAAQVAQIGTNQTDIAAIEGKIPSAASASNQLADKEFVTDSITQGTAIFRGSYATKAALMAVQWQTTDPAGANYVSNNDYAVVLDDETQNDECWRYVYVTGTGWTPQYRINESPLTQAQLDALNSGATAAIIASIPDPSDTAPQNLGTAAAGSSSDYSRADHVHQKPTAADIGAYVKPSGGIPASDLASGVIPSVPSAYTSNPEMDGTASPGSSTAWARGDHVHPSDTSRAPAGYGLGVKVGTLTPIADADDTTLVTGWFATSSTTLNLPAGLTTDDKTGMIYNASRGEYVYQEFYCNRRNRVYVRLRGWSGGTYAWTPWTRGFDQNNPVATEQQIAYIETGTTASRAYSIGECFCWNGLLYRVTAAISSGEDFTVGTNCEATTVGAALTGKAPAGYGLGVMTRDIGTSVTDCNNIDVTGWFDVAAGAANRPSGLSQYYQAVIYSVVRGPIYSYQEYYDYNTGRVYRRFKNTTWGAWTQI